jgi:DNA-binding CsgD family transcriptional regulator
MPRTRDDEVGLAQLLVQARITNRLLAAQLKASLGQQEMVRLLSTTGASNGEIADVLNTTAATVATTLQRLKRREKEGAAEPSTPPAVAAGATTGREL